MAKNKTTAQPPSADSMRQALLTPQASAVALEGLPPAPQMPAGAERLVGVQGLKLPKKKAKASVQPQDADMLFDAQEDTPEPAQEAPTQDPSVLLAQAPVATVTDAPSSVGEALLRQAQPAPAAAPVCAAPAVATKAAAGLFGGSWALPVALGAGGLAIAAASSGGDTPAPTPTPTPTPTPEKPVEPVKPAPEPEKPSEPVTPTTYDLKIMPMVGPINGGITINVKDSSGVLLAQLKVDSMGSEPLTLQVERSKLRAGQVLHLELVDDNGTGVNYRDVATNKSFSLTTPLNAWTVVPNDIADKGTLKLAITPLTELAANEMLAAKTAATDSSAPTQDEVLAYNNAVAKLFMLQTSGDNALDVDLAQTHPVATNAGSTFATASASQQAYGRVLAVISGLAKTSNSTSDLTAALQALETGVQKNADTFSMTPELTAALQKALTSYNETAPATFFKLPGLVLTEKQLSLGEKRVGYDEYDNGLSFKLYAPPGLAVGTEVIIRLQALDANGQPIEGKTFDVVHKLTAANDRAAYTGETVIIKTMDGEVQLDARAPVVDNNGNTLIAWDAAGHPTGVGVPDVNGVYSFDASVVGQSWPLGNTRFKVDGHRVSVTNIGNTESTTATATPAGYVKQGDTIEVRVVLDNDILWSDIDDKRPTFDISCTVINGDGVAETVTKTLTVKEGIVSSGLTLPDSGIVSSGTNRSTTMGRTLVFQYTFGPDEKVVGPITVGENALKAPVGAEKFIANVVGNINPADGQSLSVLVSGGTQLPSTHLEVDTVAPEVWPLARMAGDTPTNVLAVGGEDVSFTKDITPNFSLALKLKNELADLTVKLYAYAANADRSTAVQIAQKTVKGDATSVSFDDASAYIPGNTFLTKNWQPLLNKLGAQGQYLGFYAEVEDAAGNVAQTLESSDVKLWLDHTAPVAFTVQFEPSMSSQDTDPNATDRVTGDTTPTFTVTGEGGATARLYLDANKDGVLDDDERKIVLGSVVINGDYGSEAITTHLTVEEANKLEDGEHQFLLTLTDAAGNTSDAQSAGSLTVDTQVEGSVIAALVPPASGYYRVGDTLTITLSFSEKISKNPLYTGDLANAYILFTVGDASYEAKLDISSLGTSSLRFNYKFREDDSHDRVQVVLGLADLYGATEGALVDRAGNVVTNALLNSKTVIDPGTVLVDTVAPPAPVLVLSAQATPDDFLVNYAEALRSQDQDGFYKVTAEAGSTVKLSFNQGSTTKDWTSFTAAAEGNTVVLTEDELKALGLSGDITLKATSTDAAGNQSTAESHFTLDVLAPFVQGVNDNQTASVVGKRTGSSDTVIQFTVTLNEALKTPLSVSNFAVKDGMGTVSAVTANSDGTYTVAVQPASDKEGELVLQLTNTTDIADIAGNPLQPKDLDTVGGKQAIDTKPPVVTKVTDNITNVLTNGTIVFTVEFNEAIQDNGYGTSNFSASNATVVAVRHSSPNTLEVTVEPDRGLRNAEVVLSIKAGDFADFQDLYDNTLTPPGVLAGATQRVDNVAPDTPTLSLNNGQSRFSASKALAGVVDLVAEKDATVTVTYTRGDKKLTQVRTATGGTDVLTLSADEVRTLGDGAVQVDVVVQDAAGNTRADSLAGGFTLDTLTPSVSAVIDPIAGNLGGAQSLNLTVVFDEDVVGTPTAANFVAIDPVSKASSTLVQALTDANVTRLDAKTFAVILTPKSGVTGAVALHFKGTGLTDAAGNALADADLSAINTQAIQTQAPQVTTVTDTFASDYANAASTVDFIVTFNTALKSDLGADVLKSGFVATHGTVAAVTAVPGSGNLQYKVSVTPAANVADGQIGLQLTGTGLVDALGNRVQATSASSPLGGHVQALDSSAPAAPTVSLAAGSDTGSSNSDGITSNNRPSLLISGVEDGADVRVYRDANNSGTYDAGDTVLVQAKATDTTLTAQISFTLADGTYNDIRASQTDTHGNASPYGVMPTLEISTSAPGVLTNLGLDYDQDTTLIGSPLSPPRDQATDRATPKIDFTGGTVGNTVLLFNDKNTNNQLDDGEFLGSAVVTSEVSSAVEVSPYHALTAGRYPNVKVIQVSASGVRGAASAALRGELGQILTINPASPADITIASSEAADPSAKNTLVFSVAGAMTGSTIQVLADQYDASGTILVAAGIKLPEGVATNALSDNLAIDVSGLNGQFKNFRAYQRFGGVDGRAAEVTGLTTVTLDHVAPTLRIETTDADLALNETAQLTFSFSEKVTGFEPGDITGLGDGRLTGLATADDGKTWTATYTPGENASQNLSLSVAAGALKDLAGNANVAAASLAISVQTAQAPRINAPESISTSLYAGMASDINDLFVLDANNDLVGVTLTVGQGTLSLTGVDASIMTVTGVGTSTISLSKNPDVPSDWFEIQLVGLLASLKYTANGTLAVHDTLSIQATDGVRSSIHSVALQVLAAPKAPVNALVVPGDLVLSGQTQAIQLSVQDADGNLQTVLLGAEHGTLTVVTPGLANVLRSPDGRSLVVTGVQADIANALSSLQYTSEEGYVGSDTIRVQSMDTTLTVAGGPLVDADSISFTVKAKPVSQAGADVGMGQIYAGVAYDLQGLSVSDLDKGLETVKVSVSAGTLRLSGPALAALSLTGEGSSTLIFTKNADASAVDSEAELQAVLNRLSFTASGAASATAPVVLTLTSTDSDGLVGTDTANFVVQAAPVAPVNSVPTSPVGAFSGVAKALTGFSVSDADGNLQTVLLGAEHGTLTIVTPGLANVMRSPDGRSLVVTGVQADIANALNSLQYTSEEGYVGSDTIRVQSTDTTLTVAGGPLVDADSISLVVLAPPVNSMGSTVPSLQARSATTLTGLSVADADSASTFTSVTLSVGHGTLSLTAIDGVSLSGTGSVSSPLVLRADSLSALNAALATVKYTAEAHFVGTDTLTLTSQDGSASSLGGPLSDTDTLNLTVVNSPASGSVAISGDATVGSLLSANTTGLEDANGVGTLHYQWYAGDTAVGTDSSTYQLTTADRGKSFKLQVSYTDGAGQGESLTSDLTAAVVLPTALDLGKTLAFTDSNTDKLDGALTTAPGAQFVYGHNGYYLLDVNGDGEITAADRTTYAADLETDGVFTTSSGVKLQLLSVSEWQAVSAQLLSQPNWPNGSKDVIPDNGRSDGNDFWTRDAISATAQSVFSTDGVYALGKDRSGFDNALHYHAFKVI